MEFNKNELISLRDALQAYKDAVQGVQSRGQTDPSQDNSQDANLANNNEEAARMREAMQAYKDAVQGMQSREQPFTPQEIAQAADSTHNPEELARLHEYALQHRENANDDQTEGNGQNPGQRSTMGRSVDQTDDYEEKVKVKSKGMSL